MQFEIEGDRVPFPFSDRRQAKRRPAVLPTLDESLVLAQIGALATVDRRAVTRSLRSAIAR